MENLQDIVERRRWKFAGHLVRISQGGIPENTPQKKGKRKRDRHLKRLNSEREDYQLKGYVYDVLPTIGKLKRWKSLIAECPRRNLSTPINAC